MKDIRIIFMGTPEFAVASLDALYRNNYNIVAVITAPDKPAGRGKKIQQSAVKRYASKHKLNILQPSNLKDTGFIEEIKRLKADLQIVVAFRMLPEVIWNMPPLGTFNLHASLLPQYRGAAPINWVIINGEQETGLTTFFLKHEIDTGDIIYQKKFKIGENETAGELHDRLMIEGSDMVLKTTQDIINGVLQPTPQDKLIRDASEIKQAPKLNKETCRINWHDNGIKIFNLVRGLNPYPTAYTKLITPQRTYNLKIYSCDFEDEKSSVKPGSIETDQKTYLKIRCNDGWIILGDIQLESKKRMDCINFLLGFKIDKKHVVK